MCSEEALSNPACLHEAKKMKTHLCPMQHSSTEGTVRGKKREKSAPKKSWGLAFTCNTSLMLYVCVRRTKTNTLITLCRKASTPISKINGKTSQSKLSPGQQLPWNSAAGSTLVLSCSLHYVPALSPVTLERTLLTENCQQIGRYDLKNNLKKKRTE